MNERFNTIVSIILMSPQYKMGDIGYTRDNNGVYIYDAKQEGVFYNLEICVLLSAFSMYISIKDNQPLLKVY